MTTPQDAKRLIALSPDGLRLLGAGVSRSCSQERYNMAARVALEDTEYTRDERALILSYVVDTETRAAMIHLRVSEAEKESVVERARADNISVSEYIRRRVLDLEAAAVKAEVVR